VLCVIAGPFLAKALPVRAVTAQCFVDHMLTVTVPSRDWLLGVTRALIITPHGLSLVNLRSDFPYSTVASRPFGKRAL
jgi:hypothetical protein